MGLISTEHANKYQRLFNFMNQEHDLILTCEQMDEIISESQKFIEEYNSKTKKMRKITKLCKCKLPIMRSVQEVSKNRCKICKSKLWK